MRQKPSLPGMTNNVATAYVLVLPSVLLVRPEDIRSPYHQSAPPAPRDGAEAAK